ncbi:MAG: hypothetical protein EA399_12525 [Desulfovibrionales bacterium]|nr:MAG: hypothetical protein EA399_12525 [Desulfovibrionales bacterium]
MPAMTHYAVLIATIIFFLGFSALSGCASLTRPEPERRHYLLQVQRPGPVLERPMEAPILAVRSFRTAPAADSRGIVTIRSDGLVQRNFYDRFFVPPGEMLAGQFRIWLGQSGLFSLVTGMGMLIEPDLILEGYIQELHQDLSHGKQRAVMAMQMLLLRPTRSGDMEVVAQYDFNQIVDLPDTSIDSLVNGWNLALKHILVDLENSLRDQSFQI